VSWHIGEARRIGPRHSVHFYKGATHTARGPKMVKTRSNHSTTHGFSLFQFVAACRRPIEYLSGGSLRSFLHKREPGSVSLKEFVSIALDIA